MATNRTHQPNCHDHECHQPVVAPAPCPPPTRLRRPGVIGVQGAHNAPSHSSLTDARCSITVAGQAVSTARHWHLARCMKLAEPKPEPPYLTNRVTPELAARTARHAANSSGTHPLTAHGIKEGTSRSAARCNETTAPRHCVYGGRAARGVPFTARHTDIKGCSGNRAGARKGAATRIPCNRDTNLSEVPGERGPPWASDLHDSQHGDG